MSSKSEVKALMKLAGKAGLAMTSSIVGGFLLGVVIERFIPMGGLVIAGLILAGIVVGFVALFRSL